MFLFFHRIESLCGRKENKEGRKKYHCRKSELRVLNWFSVTKKKANKTNFPCCLSYFFVYTLMIINFILIFFSLFFKTYSTSSRRKDNVAQV